MHQLRKNTLFHGTACTAYSTISAVVYNGLRTLWVLMSKQMYLHF